MISWAPQWTSEVRDLGPAQPRDEHTTRHTLCPHNAYRGALKGDMMKPELIDTSRITALVKSMLEMQDVTCGELNVYEVSVVLARYHLEDIQWLNDNFDRLKREYLNETV